jgi:rod shape determining protein RodA
MLITTHAPAPGSHTRTRSRGLEVWRHLDVVLIAAVVVIAAFGALMVYSSTKVALETDGDSPTFYLKKQLIFIAIGVVAMLVVAAIDYHRWIILSPVLYVLCLLMLLAVFGVGQSVNGSQKWFQVGSFQLEPSEFAKLGLILALAAYAARYKGRLTAWPLVVIMVLAVVPFVLIFKQPDLGSALVLSAVLIALVCIAGAKLWHLALLALVAIIGVFGLIDGHVLHRYQIERLTSFAHTPTKISARALADKNNLSAQGEFNVIQSKDAISNGGLTGTGVFKGTATNLSLVPEQHTDFIFSAVGEQVGLFGCVVLLMLFLLVIWRTWRAASVSSDLFGTLVAVGVLAMLVFQIFENVGMTMGIMPVAGIPLPWMSYGGSAIIVDFVAVGLVLSIRMRRAT